MTDISMSIWELGLSLYCAAFAGALVMGALGQGVIRSALDESTKTIERALFFHAVKTQPVRGWKIEGPTSRRARIEKPKKVSRK